MNDPATDYRPTSRRPIASVFRRTADAAVRVCIAWRISPDMVSYASIVAAALAMACLLLAARWPWLLLVAPVFCYVRLWCNMLDGMVAIASKSASKRGEIVNEVPDRVSDILIFAGVAHCGFANPTLAYWAAILAVMTAYIGVTGQAVAGVREYGGMMSKPWRMVLIHLGAWTTWLMLLVIGHTTIGTLTALDWASVLIIAGCVQTCIVRLRNTVRRLG